MTKEQFLKQKKIINLSNLDKIKPSSYDGNNKNKKSIMKYSNYPGSSRFAQDDRKYGDIIYENKK